MTKKDFELPDMDDYIAQQMEKAMSEAQQAMEDLPTQMEGLDNMMGALSSLVGGMSGGMPSGMSTQMNDLSSMLEGFGEQHEANVASLAGEPNWSLAADIQVGTKLHVVVHAVFDLDQLQQAWNSTQSAGFESLVSGVVAENVGEMEDGMMPQVMAQLQKGRSIAVVKDIDVLACRIQGAPGDAAETLQLSPEGNIPLVLDEGGLGFEFAPVLTIRNQWEHANIPTFSPMGKEIMVPFAHFKDKTPFELTFELTGQTDKIVVKLRFRMLDSSTMHGA